MNQAIEGINNLKEYVDSLVVIPNDKLKLVSETKITMMNGKYYIVRESVEEIIQKEIQFNRQIADGITKVKQ